MKISGFTIIKNALVNYYPVVEAIKSVLPVVHEMIVLVGDSTDDTRMLINNINDPKIKIFDSVWDNTLREGGKVLAVETDKAFQLIDPSSDWAFYIQGDEVVHEKYYAAISEACEKYKDDKRVQGLVFKYLHFYGSYDYVGDSRKWYSHEVRIIRNNKAITAYRDAQGFRIGKTKLQVKPVEAYIYHYGWVKSPEQMKKKMKEVSRFWHDDDKHQEILGTPDYFDFSDFDSLEMFTGTHPEVMKKRVTAQNWKLEFDLSKKKFSFTDKLLYWFEKKTGIRLFDFRNYKIIKP